MSNKRILYILLAAYLVGNLLLIFIQYNWAKNLNTLIHGNEQLVNEFAVSGQLMELERDIISVESRIRGTINTEDTAFISGLEQQVFAIEANLDKLKYSSTNDSSFLYISTLDRLVHDKLKYSNLLLKTFHGQGKLAAESQVASRVGKRLTDSILLTARNIELARQRHLAAVAATVDASGNKALHLGIVLIASVLVCGAFGFWYIINTIRRQNGLIYQLHLSEKKVREAALVKENFLANMSHEIRTPMNAILGFTNLLQRKQGLDSEAKQYVQTIHRSGENLLTIINDILDLSKIEAGMMRIEPAPFSLRGLLHSVEAMMRPKANEKKLVLTTTVEDAVPDVLEGDAVRLTQILVNLLGNAIKFTAEGEVAVTVKAEATKASEIWLRILVADTGIGIEAAKLETIFNRFQQAEDSVTRKYGGTGLGLSIVKELVELQGGSVAVESEIGKGATFHLVIPYKISTQEEPAPEAATPATVIEPHLQNLRVLVVEDNEINQRLLQHILSNWQVNCTIAGNGAEALQQLRNEKFDLVLMDVQMPVMDGYTAAQKIRSEIQLSIPIVAMTAHAMVGEREKCLRFGMNDYIAKPVREEQLYQVIRQHVTLTEPAKHTDVKPAALKAEYHCIQLNYLREVSAGDTEYEKLVTAQFLELLPSELQALQTAWQQQNLTAVKQVAHGMKTTISVMGLNEKLELFLDALEHGALTAETFKSNFSAVKSIAEAALLEAEAFYTSLL